MLHTDRLRLRFALECGLEIHVKLAVKHLFRFAESECRSTRETFGKFSRRSVQLVGSDNAIENPIRSASAAVMKSPV